jgi:hypothetical protein
MCSEYFVNGIILDDGSWDQLIQFKITLEVHPLSRIEFVNFSYE